MNDLKLIKKYYGENMMHLCRELFPTILETEGKLFNILKEKFAYSKFLYNDLKSQNLIFKFKDYIYSLVDVEKEELDVTKTPIELLDEAGYILYECKSEEDIQSFKKYYAKNEELCTFKDERLKSCYVFFAVKKNVDQIKREDFPKPMRQDEYGTSVISIQFSRGNINTLSIKNRYNHRVNNPDATFSNNLENIIPGLTNSFEEYYNLNINQNKNKSFELGGYVLANDGKYYKYNYEMDNIYYGPNNIIIKNFELMKEYLEKEKYLVIDYFVIDLVNKKIKQVDYKYKDSFLDELVDIKKILILRNESTKTIKITYQENKECFIEIDNQNRILSYKNEYIKEIESDFLAVNKCLEKIFLPNVEKIGNSFLFNNKNLKEINLQKVKEIYHYFLFENNCIKEINLPNIEKIGSNFLNCNDIIEEINLPKVKEIDSWFLSKNKCLKNISLPNVEKIRNGFLTENNCIKEIKLPKIKIINDSFLFKNKCLNNIFLPNLEKIGYRFLEHNESLEEINLPKVKEIGMCFMFYNKYLKNISLPNVEKIDHKFLSRNESIEEINFPKLEEVGNHFLSNTKKIKNIFLPMIEEIEDYFLYSSINDVEYIYMPNLNEESFELLNIYKDVKKSRK